MEKGSVLVTGAFGGMGYATIKLLKSKGYKVFALDKNVKDEDGIVSIKMDITKNDEIKKAYEMVLLQTDRLEAIIHFAGIYMLDSLIEIDENDFEKMFKINVFGCFMVNKIFMPLLKQNSKIIITTSELAPLDPLPFTGLYAISKSSLDKYAYSLCMELNLLDIHVSVIRSGAVKTNLLVSSTTSLDNFCLKTNLYKCNAQRFKDIVNSVEAKSVSPDKIAQKTLKILLSKKPKFVYNLNRNIYLRLLSSLPKRVQLFIIKQILKTK